MKIKNFSKIFFATLFVITASFISAGMTKGPCAPKDTCCEAYPNDTNAFLYPKDMGLACKNKYFFHADFIAMQSQQEGMEYAITNNDSPATDQQILGGDFIGFSDDHNHSWGWDAGFKIGFGGYSIHDSWLFDAEWTWLHIHQKSSINLPAGSNNEWLIPLWLAPNMYPIVSGAKTNSADWQAIYSTADFRIANPVHYSRFLVAVPNIGLRFAYIEQDYILRYSRNYGETTIHSIKDKATSFL
jgi:hypothetical protein